MVMEKNYDGKKVNKCKCAVEDVVSWIHLDGVKTAGVNGGGDGGGGGDGFHFCLKCVIRVDDRVIDYCDERSAIYRKDSKILSLRASIGSNSPLGDVDVKGMLKNDKLPVILFDEKIQ
ncbi:hypothetical protein KY290_011836 [Solanum tuberosum]|uniref:Uncharacterized protein n=1 Tax=Solanum tuberosum TaxID=4113 RepID=A0ABQ7W1T4_SOLTU|nr:hypothetical protein KY289_012321 [Solanum tuberosum]KAH0710502.1 hypothetical protein KY284_011929 [Solanum tuberosum]KAH0736162.1 hypothetical protein KY285_011869 [Solanum tuberosum]KAH0774699.1 hypothetical protein KY290_011836 [Solanum tuberosum]